MTTPNTEAGEGMARLLPCPFCGSAAEMSHAKARGEFPAAEFVRCVGNCCASSAYANANSARSAWNSRRPASTEPSEVLWES